MPIRVVGYASWYYKEKVQARGGYVRAMTNRALLDLQAGDLAASEVRTHNAEQAEAFITGRMNYLRLDDPELWKRLSADLGAAVRSGTALKTVEVRYRNFTTMRGVTIRLGAYGKSGSEVVFWMQIRRGLFRALFS